MPSSQVNPGAASVLLTAFKAIQEAAKILRVNEKDTELKIFYADLTAYCAILRDHLSRINRAGLRLDDALQNKLLAHLSSAISPHLSSTWVSCEDHAKLGLFNKAWGMTRKKCDLDRLEFIHDSLHFGLSFEARNSYVHSLALCEEELRARYPEDPSQWTAEDFAPQKKVSEPSYAVWNAAKSIFKALVACKNCPCSPMHDFGARLCLGTYRKPALDDEDDDELDFDMFLSLKQDWQETRIHATKETVVKWAIEGETQGSQAKKKPPSKIKPMKVKRLCEPIEKIKKMTAHRLELKVIRGQLFKLQSERSLISIDKTKDSISLDQFLRGGSRSFTERTRRILAVFLSYAVLHLHDTPWLQSWSSADVVFFRTTTSAIPLRPFIQTHLTSFGPESPDIDQISSDSHVCGECQLEPCECNDIDPDDIDPDDLVRHHCPSLVTLAVMLMEVYFVTPFELLAQRYGIEIGDTPLHRTRYLDAELVFRACRDEIPENFQFHYAVEKCLDPAAWEDEDGNPLDSQLLRTKIYEEVVRPLENELIQAYSSISIDDLDRFAQTLDFGSWDQIISDLSDQTRALSPGEISQDRQVYSPSPESLYHSSKQSNLVVSVPIHKPFPQGPQYGVYAHAMYSSDTCIRRDVDYSGSKFFDDESLPTAHSREANANYAIWKARYQAVYEKFIPSSIAATPISGTVKIAILDTGIDFNHPDVEARLVNIVGKYNWLHENASNRVHDRNGHGTFSTGLLLDYAPDAQIYIAKIAEDKPSKPDIIANAINYAVETWQVDIISMSFGFPTCDIDGYEELEAAIMNAYSKHVLLFAAASNSGGKLGRAFPARDQNVICIHSTDTNGNRSPFSPTAIPDDVNLATVGEAVESAWPVHLCDDTTNPFYVEHKSGTSYATPIAAGIAAFLLQYARLYIPEKANMLKRQKRMKAVLRRVAEKGPTSELRDGYHFVDLSLYADSLFGKDRKFIDLTIGDLLSS